MTAYRYRDDEEWKRLGIELDDTTYGPAAQLTDEAAERYRAALERFLKSPDFMKLGQAISHERWEGAAMAVRRMDSEARELGLVCMERPFVGLRQSINRRNASDAKQILAGVISRRVQLIKMLTGEL